MPSIKNDTGICCLIPDGICPRYAANVDGDYGEPGRDGNCADNEIPLPNGDDAENDKAGSENESEIGEKKYTLDPYSTIYLMRSVKTNEY